VLKRPRPKRKLRRAADSLLARVDDFVIRRRSLDLLDVFFVNGKAKDDAHQSGKALAERIGWQLLVARYRAAGRLATLAVRCRPG